jgi:hypothetical protein
MRVRALAILLALPSLAAADVTPPAATAPSADLSIRLELLQENGAHRYRIVHTLHGKERARFVTGSTDRNCEDPVDLLVVDGRLVPLISQLPCSGRAFWSSTQLAPGESWTLAGNAIIPAGARSVSARYCPTKNDLDLVNPEERRRPGPKWWTGCVESAAVPAGGVTWTATTPAEAWRALLAAMNGSDPKAVERYTTPSGIASLYRSLGDEFGPSLFQSLGKGWMTWEIRFQPATRADRVEARLGPVSKEHTLEFKRDNGTWRLDRWSPGE